MFTARIACLVWWKDWVANLDVETGWKDWVEGLGVETRWTD
ncbi:hypothetical protein [Pedobacter sp. UYP1]